MQEDAAGPVVKRPAAATRDRPATATSFRKITHLSARLRASKSAALRVVHLARRSIHLLARAKRLHMHRALVPNRMRRKSGQRADGDKCAAVAPLPGAQVAPYASICESSVSVKTPMCGSTADLAPRQEKHALAPRSASGREAMQPHFSASIVPRVKSAPMTTPVILSCLAISGVRWWARQGSNPDPMIKSRHQVRNR
jgi:hypothetical protein